MNLTRLVDEGERYGIPILAVTAVGREMSRDSRYLGLSCRIAAKNLEITLLRLIIAMTLTQ